MSDVIWMLQLDFNGERLKVLQSNAESNHTEVALLQDKNTKFIASLARHQETISKLQEVVIWECTLHTCGLFKSWFMDSTAVEILIQLFLHNPFSETVLHL